MAYTSPLQVFQSMQAAEQAEESFSDVSSGDTLQLANPYIVEDGLGDSTIDLVVGGNSQPESSYTVDFDRNAVEYTGSDSGDATVRYRFGPFSNAAVQNSIEAVTDYIDEYTNTTFNGEGQVTDELYDGAGEGVEVYPFRLRPVRSVSKVSVNRPETADSATNYVEMDEGLGGDYTDYNNIGIRFLPGGVTPDDRPGEIKVSYEYGYSKLPSDVRRAATEMVVDDLVRGTVSGAMVDGRDNFDPQTVDVNVQSYRSVLDEYRIERYENVVDLAEPGTVT